MDKVYVVTNPMPIHNNSPAVSLGKFIQVVCAAGYDPIVMGSRLPEDGIPGVSGGVKVISFAYGGKGIFKLISFLLLQIRMFFCGIKNFRKGDAVYFWIADKMIGPFLAARLKHCEINYFLYGRVFGDGREGLSAKLALFMMNRASYVCAEAPSVLSQWNVNGNHRCDSIQLFVPKSDTEFIPYANRTNIVAMFCRLCHGKHIDDSIRAFCKVHEKFPDHKLRIIGGGVLEDESRRLIDELGAKEYISITGWLAPSEARENIAGCRLLLYPTDAEGVPGSVLESMSLGVPALVSPVGGIPDVIDDGVNGVFLSATDEDTIAAELIKMLASDKLEEMSRAAADKIKTAFSLDVAAENFRAVKEGHKF